MGADRLVREASAEAEVPILGREREEMREDRRPVGGTRLAEAKARMPRAGHGYGIANEADGRKTKCHVCSSFTVSI
jgi:hypothetical protein